MIQTVGIKFQADGITEIVAAMKAMGRSVNTLVTSLKALENLNTSAALSNMYKLAHGMGNAASMLSKSAQEINSAVASFTGANAVVGRGRPAGATGTSTGTGSGSSEKKSPWYSGGAILGTTANLAKYTAAFGLLYGGKQLAVNAMGAGREDMAEPGFRLTGVGITKKEDKRKIERDVTQFLIENPYMGSISEGVAGAAEMASGWAFGDKKYPAMTMELLNKFNRMNMVYAKLAEMTPKQAADSGVLTANALLGKMTTPERESHFTNPEKLEALYDRILGLQQKVIDVSKMSGQDIAEANKHGLPMWLSHGFDYESFLTTMSLEKDVGLRVSSGARAVKNIFTHKDDFGRLMALGDPDEKYAAKVRAMKPGAQKEEGYRYFNEALQYANGDIFKLLDVAAKARKLAQDRKINVEKLTSKEFAQFTDTILNPEFTDKARARRKELREEYLDSGQREQLVKQANEDENPIWKRMTQQVDALSKTIGDSKEGSFFTELGVVFGKTADAAMFLANALAGNAEVVNASTSSWWDKLNEWRGANDKRTELVKDIAFFNENRESIESKFRWNPDPLSGIQDRAIANLNGETYSPFARNMGNLGVGAWDANKPFTSQTVQVEGRADVTVTIDDQGFFERVKKVVMNLTNNTGGTSANTTSNSTGRSGYHTDVAPRFGGYGE